MSSQDAERQTVEQFKACMCSEKSQLELKTGEGEMRL